MPINSATRTVPPRGSSDTGRRLTVSNQRKILKEMAHYLPSVIIPSLAGFVAVAVFTRLLTPQQYGLYTLMFTACVFTHTFFISWLNKSIVRYHERYRNTQAFISTCVGVLAIALMGVSMLWLIAVFLLRPLVSTEMGKLLFWGPPVVFFYSVGHALLAFLRAMRKSSHYALLTSLNAVLKLALGATFIVGFGLGASGILLGIIASGALLYFPHVILTIRKWRLRLGMMDRAIFSKLLRYGIPVMGVSIASMILSASDRYLVEAFLGAAQVGIYDAGYRVTESCLQLLTTFLAVAFMPALVDVYENQGEGPAQSFMPELFRIHLFLMVPATAGVCLLAETLIRSLLGGPFHDAVTLVPWIAVGVFTKGVTGFFTISITLKERTRTLIVLFAPPAIANILLNLWMIPAMGIKGAAIATFLSYGLCLVLVMIAAYRLLPWKFPWQTTIRVGTATLVMALAIKIVPSPVSTWTALIVKIGLGVGVYVAVMLCVEKSLLVELRRIGVNRLQAGHARR